jgi:hypothetical protein
MRLILESVKPEDVVKNEVYLLFKKHKAMDGCVTYEEWIESVASPKGWVFDDAPDVGREWPSAIFQSPMNGKMVE